MDIIFGAVTQEKRNADIAKQEQGLILLYQSCPV
jgi:hypothetical protein